MSGKKKLTILVAIFAVLALGAGTALAAIITNGDFEGGNVGFTSGYLYFDTPLAPASGYSNPKASLYDEGTYGVGTDPADYHVSWSSFGDHTTGSGNMMIVNGDRTGGTTVWATSSNELVPGGTYEFSAWLASVYPAVGAPPISPAQLAFSINGGQIDGGFTLTANVGNWQQFTTTWVAPSNLGAFSVINLNVWYDGNDFAIDDISVRQVPEPSTLLLLGSGLLGLVGYGRKRLKK